MINIINKEVKMIESIRKIKIAEIEQEIAKLKSAKIKSKKYNWIERKILKTTEYKEEQKRIIKEEQKRNQKIDELIEKKRKISVYKLHSRI